jgi:orotidine-5'-phosphate decarboxylase
MSASSPVFCAIDRPDLDGALELSRALIGAVGGLKVGLEFVTANGPDGVRRIVDLGLPVFLDIKLHDIPNTVAGAVRAATRLGVAMLTVHVSGGPAMLRAALDAAREAEPCPQLLGVTVLTSFDDADLAALGLTDKVADHVLRLSEMAWNAGLDGLVCAPPEIPLLRTRFEAEVKIVVPGIRPAGSVKGDQKRTLTPSEAMERGADILVIGRPITAAPDPRAAALAIMTELEAARAA